jgi:hypothetical protein
LRQKLIGETTRERVVQINVHESPGGIAEDDPDVAVSSRIKGGSMGLSRLLPVVMKRSFSLQRDKNGVALN